MRRALLLAVLALAACGRGPAPVEDKSGAEADSARRVTARYLFASAHRSLREGETYSAARTFESLRDRPDSTLAAEATYWAAFARYRLGDPESLTRARELLAALIRTHPDDPLAADAAELELRILGRLAGLDTGGAARAALEADSILSACDGDDPYAPALALSGLVRSDPARGMAALEAALTGGACSAEARHNALYAVPLRSGEAGAALLDRVAREDPDPSVRLDAAIALQRFAGRGGLDRLLGLWDVAETRGMKEQLILQYGALDGPTARAKLLAIAGTDPEPWARIFARAALEAGRRNLLDRLLPL